MLNFELATPGRVVFGVGSFQKLGALAAEMGWRALVTSGFDLERSQPLLEILAAAQVVPTLLTIHNEPTVEVVQRGVELAHRQACDLVIGMGGGSAMDAGKAIAALVTNPGEVLDYLEVVGRGRSLSQAPLPFIAIPTTAGTGAEATRNAVIRETTQGVKVSLRSPLMLPKLALVDPQLTVGLPPEITASTGMDALTQLIEPFVCPRANPITDALCREGMRLARHSLLQAYENGADLERRQDMSLASLFSGIALANAGLGVVHGFAGVLGGMYSAPHGQICARLLPFVMETNLRAIQRREPQSPALERYTEISAILTGDRQATIEDGVAWLQILSGKLHIPGLRSFGLSEADFPAIIQKTAKASSTRGNPVKLTDEEFEEILNKAL
jgi:alcohol dehydrogenase class IV